MMIHDCIPCQYGFHDEHHDVPNPGIEGLIGGRWECHCKGECVAREEERRRNAPLPVIDTTDYGPDGELAKTLEFLRSASEAQK